jgi:hypothetical protein
VIAAVVVGWAAAAAIAVTVLLVAAGPRRAIRRDPTFAADEVAGRHVSILGALAGFAVTAIVLLVTQARNLPSASGVPFTTLLTMFVVAYMGYLSASLLFGAVSQRDEPGPFDLAAAQFAGASIALYSVFIGWLALKPLFEAFALAEVATLAGWLVTGAVIAGFAQLASALHRSGYADVRLLGVLGAATLAGALAWLALGAAAPGLRSPDATLQLTIVAFVAGLPAYAALSALPIAARSERLAPVLAERWHLVLLAYAQVATMTIAFLVLAVLGVA